MDLDALREAERLLLAPHMPPLSPDQRVNAAYAIRAVLDSEEANYCKEHKHSSGRLDRCPYGFRFETTPCEIEPVLLVRVRLLAEEGT